MDPSPRFLTALPVYNEHSHVNPVLDEVIRYSGDVLVVDDGSTDDSVAVIDELALSTPLIRFFRNQDNEGLVPAQSRAIAAATGQYVHLAAADDMILPGFYATAIKLLEQYPDAGLFTGDSLLFDGTTGSFVGVRPIVMPRFKPGYLSPANVYRALPHSDNWILTGASVIRINALRNSGGLDKQLETFADGFLTRKVALTYGYCYAPKFVSTWMIFPTSASHSRVLDPKKAAALQEAAYVRLSQDPIFPAWYPARFANNLRFASARLALMQKPVDIPTVATLGGRTSIDEAALTFILKVLRGALGRLIATAWLCLRLRPYRLHDLATTFIFRKLFTRTGVARKIATGDRM